MIVSAMDVYKLLPQTNCGVCGEASCMAFATKLSEKETELALCTPIIEEKRDQLENILRPAVREVKIGKGYKAAVIGGDEVLYRYELTYYNPTALVIDISDDLSETDLNERLKTIKNTEFERTGEKLSLDAIAIRNKSGSTGKFVKTVKKVKDTNLPLILCSFNPETMEKALNIVGSDNPLIYAATENNIEEMSNLALKYNCPLCLFIPNDLEKMKDLVNFLRTKGIMNIVLDPGTFVNESIGDSLDNFIMIRRKAIEDNDEDFRFPIMGVPAVAWISNHEDKVTTGMREATIAAALMNKYCDILIMHGTDIWELIPVLTLRQSLYTDPRKPQAVEAGLYEFGQVNENSPVLMTTNFALTFYTVEGDLKSAKVNCYLLVLDTGGRAVDVSVAGNQLNPKTVTELLKSSAIENKVKHRKLIIPGLAAPVSGEIEDESGWEVLVGPRDSSGIYDYLDEKW
jgi:acetyl-CoA decarbonylase/synthase complex subunit gamma